MKRFVIGAAIAAALLAPAAASAADLNGAWKLKVDVADMTIDVNCNLTQSAAALSGDCKRTEGDEKPAVLTGAVDGDALNWGDDVDVGGQTMHVTFKGQVQADGTMKGTIEVPGVSGTFTGSK